LENSFVLEHTPREFLRQVIWSFGVVVFLVTNHTAWADGPDDNVPTKVRQIPPPGIELPPAVTTELLDAARRLREQASSIDAPNSARNEILVIARAVEMAIEFPMFYSEQEVAHARELLLMGEARLKNLAQGKRGADLIVSDARSSNALRLAVGGFQSKLDESIQPYGLVFPADWDYQNAQPVRLDVWLHGRDEKTSEVEFLHRRLTQPGEFTPANTIVLHPYGRYSNAFKFAGEIDVLEAIAHVKELFSIDDRRINIRGFSMGGAGCWQMAVHYPSTWCAATPGAGFSETTKFLQVFQKERFEPTWFQKRLLHWYDCPDWANNLRHLPTVAYSGELDRQKQAADVMEQALRERGIPLLHIIGPRTDHRFHPDSKIEIESFVGKWSTERRPEFPKEIDFTTYTLRYPSNAWLHVEGLIEHWQEARVQASIVDDKTISLKTKNVRSLSIRLPANNPVNSAAKFQITVDGQSLSGDWQNDHGSPQIRIANRDGKWGISSDKIEGLAKVPGLQGPIDDAFLGPFVFVPPESFSDDAVGRWTRSEFQHACQEWRRHFRGDVPIRNPKDISEQDILEKNLVVFGTPETNSLLERFAKQLPIKWQDSKIPVHDNNYRADHHALVMIYPNPLNPTRYVVLNSGFTFREFAYLNNARQIPMLPDWAVIDVSQGADSQLPGKISAAGFFDEAWQLKTDEDR
jgi:pimeloyl-ACP methyl ester carboxylesterase